MSYATTPVPGNRSHAQLEGVNQRLAEMIDTLRKGREKMLANRTGSEPATSGPSGPPGGSGGGQRDVEKRLRARVEELEAQQQRACDEMVEVEAQLTHFAGLFAALRQLHEAGPREAVLDAIQEIVVNLVGSEELAVLEAAPDGALRVARTFGLEPKTLEGHRLGQGPLGEAALGHNVLTAPDPRLEALGSPALTALVPLRVAGTPVGAVVVQRLLGHKARLGPADQEILELLQLHAAVALRASAPRGDQRDDVR